MNQLLPPVSQEVQAQGTSIPADFVWMPGGSSGVLVTAASQTAATIGTFTGYSWNLNFHSPLQHTRGYPGSVVRPTPFSVAGVLYDGAGYNQIEFDLSAALVIGSTPLYEDVRLSFPAGVKSMTVSSPITYGMNAGSTDVSLDVLSLQTGTAYAVAQYNVTTAGLQRLRVETQGGARGQNITIPDKINAYVTDLRIKQADNYALVALINPLTSPPTLIGTSGRADTYGADLASLQIQSYLLLSTSGGGKLRYGGIGFMPSTLPFPTVKGLSIAAPTSVAAIQTASGQVTVSWSSITQQNTVQYSSDAGANWTTAVTAYDPVGSAAQAYDVTGLSNSTAYLFRVLAVAGDQSSAGSSTASVTTDNSIFITPEAAGFDGTNDYISKSSALTGLTAGGSKQFTFSFWMDTAADNVQYSILYGAITTGNRLIINKTTANVIQVIGRNSSGTTILSIASTSTMLAADGWVLWHIVCDTNQAASGDGFKIYRNGVLSGNTVTTYTQNGVIDFPFAAGTPLGYFVGADSLTGNKANASFSQLWFKDALSLDSPTSFGRFSAAGVAKPINLGTTGQTPTGSSPVLYLSRVGSGDSWAGDSSGNSNTMTVTGGGLSSPTPP